MVVRRSGICLADRSRRAVGYPGRKDCQENFPSLTSRTVLSVNDNKWSRNMKKIVVFGYGSVGREITALLVARGDVVRVAQRTAPKILPDGVTFKACDLTDREAVAAACAGRDIAICAAGFPYNSRTWETEWPKAMTALLGACQASGARFVFADNLYMLGPHGRASERRHAPHRLRAKAARSRGDHAVVAAGPCGGLCEGGCGSRL